MINFLNKVLPENFLVNQHKTFVTILIGISLIVGLTVIQDYLVANRSGYSFYLTESLLFKLHWLLFFPSTYILNSFFTKLKTFNRVGVLLKYFVLAIFFHLVLFSIVGSIFSYLFYKAHFGPYKFLVYAVEHDILSISIIYLLVILLTFYSIIKDVNTSSEPNKIPLENIIVQSGKSKVSIHLAHVFQIKSESPYICIQLENKSYLHNETLKSFLERLDEFKFVRVHKTCIVNISKVVSFTSRLNGDYDLYLANGEIVRLSRTYAADFKMKMVNTPQLKQ